MRLCKDGKDESRSRAKLHLEEPCSFILVSNKKLGLFLVGKREQLSRFCLLRKEDAGDRVGMVARSLQRGGCSC